MLWVMWVGSEDTEPPILPDGTDRWYLSEFGKAKEGIDGRFESSLPDFIFENHMGLLRGVLPG